MDDKEYTDHCFKTYFNEMNANLDEEKRDKETGLYFTPKVMTDSEMDEFMPDVRTAKKCGSSGLEEIKINKPGIVTLEDKAKLYNQKLIALAGIAKLNSMSAFKEVDKILMSIEDEATDMIENVKKLRSHLEFIRKMAVLDFNEE